jgi:hypothetical protein
MEEDVYEENRLPDPECGDIGADDDDLKPAIADREQHLAEVEAERGRGVHVAVGVVHEVEPPQQRDFVIQPVPDPQRVVEEHNRERDLDRPRERDVVQEPEAGALRP